jgi:hypothetical protein
MVERGLLIETADPKPEIRKNAEIAKDWEYSEEAKYLYDKAILFKDRFLDPILHTGRGRLPDPVISFDNLRNNRTLAAYTLHRNPVGLLDEITFNTEQYEDQEDKKVWKFGRWAQLETLLHEQVHLWQQNFGEDPIKPGKVYHNKEFVDKCEGLGLHPMPIKGCHVAVADGVFAQLMNELGIERPDMPPTEEIRIDWFKYLEDWLGKEAKGKSTLKKWCCPECGMNVRMGIAGDPKLRHHTCETELGRQVFLVPGDVYVAKR